MTSTRPGAERSPWAELRYAASRERALFALFDLGRQTGFALRAARLYAVLVFLGYALAMSLTRGSDRRAELQHYVHAGLTWLSWVVGALVALGTARVLAQPAERDARVALARARGYSQAALTRARTLSAAVRAARFVGVPGVLLVLVGFARGGTLAWALAVAPAAIVYASVLGLALALLAWLAAQLAPHRPRAMLLALVLGPLLVSQAFSWVPSATGLLAQLLARLLESGARLT